MQLWTIQTENAWRSLHQRGYLRCRRRDAAREFLRAYDWMAAQMIARIGRPANRISLPLWAWYQYETEVHRCPDLRRSAHLPRGTRGYRIEFTVPCNRVLLSDFELWHYVLNYWYLPKSERDAEEFDARHESRGGSWSAPPLNKHVDTKIRTSWKRIFDLNSTDGYVAAPRASKSIQATLWQLDLAQVTTADAFIAR
jgi:hypothetical protein